MTLATFAYLVFALIALRMVLSFARSLDHTRTLRHFAGLKKYAAETIGEAAKAAGSEARTELAKVAGAAGVAAVGLITMGPQVASFAIDHYTRPGPLPLPAVENINSGRKVKYWPTGGGPGAGYDAPDAPTIATVVLSDTSAYFTASPFSGSLDDSVEYTIFELDTLGGDFTYTADTQTVATGHPLRSDTILTFPSGGTPTWMVRAKHGGLASGLESAYSATDTFTVEVEGSYLDTWMCDWSYGITADASTFADSLDTWLGQANGNDGTSGANGCYDAVSGTGYRWIAETLAKPSLANSHAWPTEMTNVYRVAWDSTYSADSGSSFLLQVDNAVDTVEVGQYKYHRLYDYRTNEPGEEMSGHWYHGGTNASGGNYPGVIQKSEGTLASDSSYLAEANVGIQCISVNCGGRGAGGYRLESPDKLKTFHLYRREIRAYRFHADSISYAYRVYDGTTGTLLYDQDDFVCFSGSDSGFECEEGVDVLGSGPTYNGAFELYWTGAHEIGNNGTSEQPTTRRHTYFGGLAIATSESSNAWIGAYPNTAVGEGGG